MLDWKLGIEPKMVHCSNAERGRCMNVIFLKSFSRNVSGLLLGASLLFVVSEKALGIIDPTLQMQLGNISGATADPNNHQHFLIQRSVESIDYSDTNGCPNWASWGFDRLRHRVERARG